jgi:hypothetical protein
MCCTSAVGSHLVDSVSILRGYAERVTATAQTGRWGGLLRQRNFRLFWTGETISEFGNSVTLVVIDTPGQRRVRASDQMSPGSSCDDEGGVMAGSLSRRMPHPRSHSGWPSTPRSRCSPFRRHTPPTRWEWLPGSAVRTTRRSRPGGKVRPGCRCATAMATAAPARRSAAFPGRRTSPGNYSGR